MLLFLSNCIGIPDFNRVAARDAEESVFHHLDDCALIENARIRAFAERLALLEHEVATLQVANESRNFCGVLRAAVEEIAEPRATMGSDPMLLKGGPFVQCK